MKAIPVHFLLTLTLLISCSPSRQLQKLAEREVLNDSSLRTAHVGISLFDPATGKYLYNYQGDKYFVPASNTKIPTLYAALRYLGDSLVGLRYELVDGITQIFPTGDPTLLHPDFRNQPVLDFLKRQPQVLVSTSNWRSAPWGSGWAWNDYTSSYMAERSPLPVYGNVGHYRLQQFNYADNRQYSVLSWKVTPVYFKQFIRDTFSLPLGARARREMQDTGKLHAALLSFDLHRPMGSNDLSLVTSGTQFRSAELPFSTDTVNTAIAILGSDHGIPIRKGGGADHFLGSEVGLRRPVYSQPTDSVLKPLMHRSDNFFAEQILLMAAEAKLGVLSESRIIDTLLRTDFADLPQKPRWADGSGLSRYNLFTPQDMVAILHKMQQSFGMDRLKEIFATAGEGTISSYYKGLENRIFAKTGTLSGVVALSGYLYTRQNRLLIFSVLVNNHHASATAVRRAVERWLRRVERS